MPVTCLRKRGGETGRDIPAGNITGTAVLSDGAEGSWASFSGVLLADLGHSLYKEQND
jgi:hypothetical protein